MGTESTTAGSRAPGSNTAGSIPGASGVETPAIVDALVELSVVVHDVLARVSAEFDLSVTQLRLFGILRDRTPAMTAIADHLGLDRSSVTGLVDRAERRGLVIRVASRRDARVTRVQITTEGLALVGRAAARVTSELEVLVAGVPDADQGQLVRVVSSVLGGQPGRRSLDAPD